MKLNVKRIQKEGKDSYFSLRVILELSNIESSMLKEYNLHNLIVIQASKLKTYYFNLLVIAGSILLSFVVSSFIAAGSQGPRGGIDPTLLFFMFISLTVGLFITFQRYLTPHKRIQELIEGYNFDCRSLTEIKEIEKNIEDCSIQLKKLIEDCAFFGGVDIIEIERDKTKDIIDGEKEELTVFKEKYIITKTRYKKDPEIK